MGKKMNDDFIISKEDLLILEKVINRSKPKIVNIRDDYELDYISEEIVIVADCTEKEIEISLDNLPIGVKVCIVKMDESENLLKITTNNSLFWTKEDTIYFNGQFDTIVFFKVDEAYIIGV
jgi:hypothetical protein